MKKPKVWNVLDPKCPKKAIYIGRPTIFGNPFKIGKDGQREEVIRKYEEFFMRPSSALLRYIARKRLKGKHLACFCAPKPCHGDVLLRYANEDKNPK